MPDVPSLSRDSSATPRLLFIAVIIGAVLFPVALMTGVEAWLSRSSSREETAPRLETHIITPSTIRIPAVSIHAPIEHLGLTAQGEMDIPDRIDTVGWFRLGYRPGEDGSAVIAGHLNGPRGEAGVFAQLHQLKIGDIVEVANASGSVLHFAVRETAVYPYDASPLKRIFGPSDRPMLNLITCNGGWNQAEATYNHRLVVYAELID